MSTRKDVPRNGPARALWEADKTTPVSEIASVLDDVERWECTSCGQQKFTRPECCSRCGEADYRKTVPAEGRA
jgi:hypothetical protein